jgi:ribonuclease HI
MLYLYLAASDKAVSAVLIRLNNNIQLPVYYVSKTLLPAEFNYTPLEKLILALLVASRKLRHYFDAHPITLYTSHPITLYTSHPIKDALRRVDFSGRMEKWSVELGRFHIEYQPRTSIKGQVLAYFVAELTPVPPPEAVFSSVPMDNFLPIATEGANITITPRTDNSLEDMEVDSGNRRTEPDKDLDQPQVSDENIQFMEVDPEDRDADPEDMWTLYIDGSSNKTGSGAGIIIKTPEGSIIEQAVRLDFNTTNNEAEYEALVLGLKSLLKLKVKKVRIHTDSKLIACQMTGSFAAKSGNMEAYRNLAISLAKQFQRVCIGQHSRTTNAHADALATLASAIPYDQRRTIQVERITEPSTSGESGSRSPDPSSSSEL